MADIFWQNFVISGRVADYLKYKEHEEKKAETLNANINEGNYYQGTNGGGK